LQLENEVFQGQPADYMFFHLFTSGLQLAAASLFDIYVLSDGLLLSIAYLWSQHNRETPVSFMFGIRFKVFSFLKTCNMISSVFKNISCVGNVSSMGNDCIRFSYVW
jgi:hypothetical protein